LNSDTFSQKTRCSPFIIRDGAVVWPHEQDICPDTLYLDPEKGDSEKGGSEKEDSEQEDSMKRAAISERKPC